MSQLENIKLNRLGIVFLLIVAVLAAFFLYFRASHTPPSENRLVENFRAHKFAYERLREMLLTEKQVLRVASWGVETNSGIMRPPLTGDFPASRYKEYLDLLKETGGVVAFRGRGDRPESVGVVVWASGWGTDTRHVDVCWMDHEPANQVQSLDDLYHAQRPRSPAFRRIEDHWYLWAD